MPKLVDLSTEASQRLAYLLVAGTSEMLSRSQFNHLETLGVLCARILVASQVIEFDKLREQALDIAAQHMGPEGSLATLRENLNLAFNRESHLTESGITLHTIQ